MKRGRDSGVFGQDLEELCAGGKIPVFTDCISFLTKARHRERAAFCVPGLFELPVSDKKVQLLRKAYQLGRNPLQMLTLQDPRAVAALLKVWLQELREPLIRADLHELILQTQQHVSESDRLAALQALLKQNDLYRLQILIPLLELLHHHAINQDDIQYTAVMVAERFAPYLLRPSGCAVKQARQDRLVVAAATSMVLDYRSLFLHSVLDQDRYANSHMLTPRAIHVPRHRPTSVYAAVSYLMPMPPKSAPVSMHNINSEPEDFCKVGTDLYLTSSDLSHDSPYSDDLDSAFSGSSCASISSRDGDNHRQVLANQGIDNELDAAVHSLFCASTADLLIPI